MVVSGFCQSVIHFTISCPSSFSIICVCVGERVLLSRLSLFIMSFSKCVFYACIANKEEVVQKARPVSTDVGSSNPNFSDLMDEFIQERLRAKGTVVSPTL